MSTTSWDIFEKIVSVMVPVFSVIGIGYLFARWRGSKELHFTTDFITYVAAPALVFFSLADKTLTFDNFYLILASSLFVALTGVLFSWVFSRKFAGGNPAATLTVAFMNSGNMGLPVCYFAFGREGLAVATIFFVTMSIVHYTAGTALATGRGRIRDALLLPLAPAAVAGILINRFDIALPALIERPVKLLADSAIPLMLFSLGVRLLSVETKERAFPYILAGMRFLVGFSTGIAAIYLFRLHKVPAHVIAVQATMPPAVFNFILCEKFGKDPELAARTILVGTILSLLTIPLLLYCIYTFFPAP